MKLYSLRPTRKEKGIKHLIDEANRLTPKAVPENGDIAPGDAGPVLRLNRSKMTAQAMRYGLPNHWGEGEIYAAKAETVEEHSTFRKSVEERRCIVPTTGYYEHVTEGEDAGWYLFHITNTDELYIAGIYNYFDDKPYYAILTVPANDSLDGFNDRMPLVLRKAEWDTWLKGDYKRLYDRDEVKLRHTKCGSGPRV